MKPEPIMTVADLEAMGPSRALRKAMEAYPDIEYTWDTSIAPRTTEGACCASGLLAVACGEVMGFDIVVPTPTLLSVNLARIMGTTQTDHGLGQCISDVALYIRAASFADVADWLEERGL